MTHASDIRFIGMEPCGALVSMARDRAEALDRAYLGIMSCHVSIAMGRKRPGHSVRLNLLTHGGSDFTTSDVDWPDVYAALRDVFDTTDRRLRDAASIQ